MSKCKLTIKGGLVFGTECSDVCGNCDKAFQGLLFGDLKLDKTKKKIKITLRIDKKVKQING